MCEKQIIKSIQYCIDSMCSTYIAVDSALHQPQLLAVINFFNALINKFMNNKPLRLSLKERTDLRLRKPNNTRWNSVYLMMVRLNEVKAAINSVGEAHDE